MRAIFLYFAELSIYGIFDGGVTINWLAMANKKDLNKKDLGLGSDYEYDYWRDGDGWTFIVWRGSGRDRASIVTEQWVTGTESDVTLDISRVIRRCQAQEKSKR